MFCYRHDVVPRSRSSPQHLADEAAIPLALLGGLILWPLRLAQAPVSTLAGFRTGCSPSARSPRPPRLQAPGGAPLRTQAAGLV